MAGAPVPGQPPAIESPADVPPCHRAHRLALLRLLGAGILKLGRWRVAGVIPEQNKLIFAGGPHTSNWDFILAMAAILALDIRVHWLAKHSIFRPPLGRDLVAVNRSKPDGLVKDITARVRETDAMVLGITPEGTRGPVAKWKTGFLRIAAAVPCDLVPVTLDYGSRCIRVWPAMPRQDDQEKAIAELHRLFSGVESKRPENFL